MNRIDIALKLLEQIYNKEFHYLGKGMSSVVFYDRKSVYKVYIPQKNKSEEEIDISLCILNRKLQFINNCSFFFNIHKIIKADPNILIYEYKDSHELDYLQEEELQDFLVECWAMKIIFKDIKKDNFRRVFNGQLKYIDFEMELYNDNLFLNMAARSYILLKYFNRNKEYIKKLNRSAINQFNLPELQGLHNFLNKVFAKIIFNEGKDTITNYSKLIEINDTYREIDFSNDINMKQLFFDYIKKGLYIKDIKVKDLSLDKNNHFTPNKLLVQSAKINNLEYKVSLVIKTCAQESGTIYEQVSHIVKQLSYPDRFCEVVVIVDVKESNFTREYYDRGSLDELIIELERLKADRIIDKYIELPIKKARDVNKRWFGLDTEQTHTIRNAPITSHLYGFEQLAGEYMLQMDSDAMIGRYNYNHSFLSDMIKEIEENKNVISIGFNIPYPENSSFNEYNGYFKGGYVPEVRMGLFHLKRLFDQRPLPNKLINNKLELSWFRSLHEKQKGSEYVSLRGGAPDSFYIHPQNYRKKDRDVWFTILDRVENTLLPDLQFQEFDLKGSYYDWTIQKRQEDVILLVLVRNITYGRFLRMWISVLSQSYTDWGMILIDDASTNGLEYFIDYIIRDNKDRVTYIKNRFRQGSAKNTYKSIHYFTDNPDSIIVTLDGDDALIGNNALQDIVNKYQDYKADMLIGKMYRTDKLTAHYKYKPNFIEPRKYGGNVWQHLRSFKKYLFDSLSIYDFKIRPKNKRSSINKKRQWIEYCGDYAMMVPMCEMASNPLIMDEFNYYFDKTTETTSDIRNRKDYIISELLSKPKKSKQDIVTGRIKFVPDFKLIEIDITYECNLKCISCNRSCTQAPTEERMSINQIREFINESIEENYSWKVISVLGGEPTLHPDFTQIIKCIYNEYILRFSQNTKIKIVSNGYTEHSRKLLDQVNIIPNVVINGKSFKVNNKPEYFIPFNKITINEDLKYSKACWVTSYCGIGLNKYGYYGCSVAGGIDRVIGIDKGIKRLKKIRNNVEEHFSIFCKYCGNFYNYSVNKGDFIPREELNILDLTETMSEIWHDFYKNYRKNRPILTEIYGD